MGIRGKGAAIAWLRAHVAYEGDNCLIWPFSVDRDGYGNFGFEGRSLYAHRWMCAQANGPKPTPTHHAAHECGNGHRGCVNPRHLIWKTPKENARDRLKHGTARCGSGRRPCKLTDKQVAEILALKGKKTHLELAALYNVTDSQIRKIHKGVTRTGGRTYLTDDQVRMIWAMRERQPARVTAEQLGVLPDTVFRVLAGRTYKYVPHEGACGEEAR